MTALLAALLGSTAAASTYARGGFTLDLPIYADGSTRVDLDRLAREHGVNSRHYRIRKAVVYANSWGHGSWAGLRIGKRNTPEYHFASSYDAHHHDGFEAVRIPVHQRHSRHWTLRIGRYTSVRNIVLHLVPAHYAYDRHHVSSLYLAPRLYWYDSHWHRAPRLHGYAHRHGLRRGLDHGYRGFFFHNPRYRDRGYHRKHRRDNRAAFGYRDGYHDGRRDERRADRRADRREEQRRAERRAERREEHRREERRAERRAERREEQRRAERRAERRERREERHAGVDRNQRRGQDHASRDQRREHRGREHRGRGRDAENRSSFGDRQARRDDRESRPRHWRGNKPEDGVRRQQWSRERR